MKTFFVDTTVLTNVLLKDGTASAVTIRKALASRDSELPVFAIREFKAGPLQYFAYAHNKLLTTKSYAQTLDAIQALSRTPQRYRTATALEALRIAHEKSIASMLPAALANKHGVSASFDTIMADENRLALKVVITRAWRNRRSVTTRVVLPLSCYQEVSPWSSPDGRIELKPSGCEAVGECCLAARLKGSPDILKKLKDANDALPEGRESKKRGRVLRELIRKPKQLLDEQSCRALGDALFAFFAPPDSAVLTTNTKDHEPLAASIGKSAVDPKNV